MTEEDLSLTLDAITDDSTEELDILAVRKFSFLLQRSPDLVKHAQKLIINKMKSPNLIQAKKAVQLLDEYIDDCGEEIRKEISKFKFLNDLVRLVSKKYPKDNADPEIRKKIMDCLCLWTMRFPESEKIKITYDQLCKEGVEHGHAVPNIVSSTEKSNNLVDNKYETQLKALLQSKNPEDIKKANLLIRYIFNQNTRKNELIIKQKEMVREAEYSVQVLDDVLQTLISEGKRTQEDEDLCNQLHTVCKNFNPEIFEDDDDLIADGIVVYEKIRTVMEKYEKLCFGENVPVAAINTNPIETGESSQTDLLSVFSEPSSYLLDPTKELCDIFNQDFQSSSASSASNTNVKLSYDINNVLTPIPAQNTQDINIEAKIEENEIKKDTTGKILSYIDEVSENLFKQNLNNNERIGSFKKEIPKKPLNELAKKEIVKSSDVLKSEFSAENKCGLSDDTSNDNLDEIFTIKKNSLEIDTILGAEEDCKNLSIDENILKKDELISNEKFQQEITKTKKYSEPIKSTKLPKEQKIHLADINIDIKSIIPSDQPPRIVKDDLQGLKVSFNFASNRPCQHVSIIVICTINQGRLSIADYQFDASVPKGCKLRLFSPSDISLPGVNPFDPPTQNIRQILLIYNPTEKPINITCILGYVVENDPDPIKESIIIENIPYDC